MSKDSRVRDRNAFQEVMRLANASTPAKPSSGDKEDSGLIDLAILAAGDASRKAGEKSDLDRTPNGPREDEWSREGEHASAQPSTPHMSSSGVKTKQALGAALVTAPSTAHGPQWLPSAPTQSTARLIGDPSTAWRPPPSPGQVPSELNSSAAVLPPETTRPTTMVASVEQAPRAKRESTVWVALVGGVGVGALAAVLAFKIHSVSLASWLQAPSAALETVHATPTASPPPAAAGAIGAIGAIGAPPSEWKNVDVAGHANAQTAASAPQAGQPSAPLHPTAGPTVHALAGVTHDGANPKAAAPRAEAGEARPEPAPKPAPVAPAPEPTSQDKLVAMMQQAVRAETPQGQAPAAQSPASAPAAAAQANPGNLPAKPAAGAIMGALGTVMPAARYCLGPDDPVSRATITFKSDGSVENVVIAGDAAGQPAGSCIKARLMEAKVPPFSSPRFTWTVPVRPAS